jgi:undecaprenyl-diphosphatase
MEGNPILLFQSLLIAVVEGITEFLPVSSTGHMILVGHFIGFSGPFATLFEIVIQLGAILAIVVLYRKKILDSLRQLRPGQAGFWFWFAVMMGFIPFGLVAFLLHDVVEAKLMHPLPVAVALLVGAGMMLAAEAKFRGRKGLDDAMRIPWQKAVLIGLFQCLALWPGFSRSAATIIGGWMVGLTTVAAAEFSFFLALPTMVVASGYSLLKLDFTLTGMEWVSLAAGFLTAFLVALFVVDRFIRFLKHRPMRGFAWYRLVVGLVILLLSVGGVL